MLTEARTSKPFIRALHDGDTEALAKTMRIKDRAEVFHSAKVGPLLALELSVVASDQVYTIVRHGEVVAIFGVSKTSAGASPWMLGADNLVHCKSLLREARVWLGLWLAEYGYLANSVWSKNAIHIKWIGWLGFQFNGESVRNGQTFLHFHRSHHV